MTIYKSAIKLLEKSDTLALSVIDEQGYPRIYPMEKVSSANLNEVIFITKKSSNKVRSLKINNKCCVEVHIEDDTVCLSGKIKIEENVEEMKQILPSEYIRRLNDRGIHQYCVLIFIRLNAQLSIDGESEYI